VEKKDEDFDELDVIDATPEVPPGFTVEDTFNLDPPLDYELEPYDKTVAAYKNQLFADYSTKFPDESLEEHNQRVNYAMIGRRYDPYTNLTDQSRIIGDPLDTNLILTPSVVSLEPRGQLGSIPIFRQQLEASQRQFDDLSFAGSVKKLGSMIFDPDPDPSTFFTAEQAQEADLIGEDFDVVRDPSVGTPEILGVDITPERMEAAVLTATGVGTVASAAAGAKFGATALAPAGPVGMVAGGLIGGLTTFGLSSLGAMGLQGAAALPDEYGSAEYALDLTRRLYTVLGIPDDFVGYLAASSPKVRDLMVTGIVELAEYLDFDKTQAWKEKHDVNSPEDLKNKGSESIRKLEKELEKRDIIPANFFTSQVMTRQMRELVNFVGDDFLLGMQEILDEIGRPPEYKEMRSQVRLNEFTKKRRYEVDELSRKQKPTDLDWHALDKFYLVDLGIEKEEDIKGFIRDWADNQSYNSMPPSIRGDMPDLAKFIFYAEQIPIDHPMFDYDLPPDVMSAIKAVHDMSATDSELQNIINSLPLGIFRHSLGFEEMVEGKIPDYDEIKSWAEETNRYLNEETGARATRIAEKESVRLMLKPVETDDHGTIMKRTALAHAQEIANILATTISEVDVGFSPTPSSKPLFDALGFPNGIYLPTGAGFDRMTGAGIRPNNSSHAARVHARYVTGTGGFGYAFNEIARAQGLKPDTFRYNLANLAGFFPDMANYARPLMMGAKRAGSAAYGAYNYSKRSSSYASGHKSDAFRNEVMGQTTRDPNVDPVVDMRNVLEDQAVTLTNRNINILQRPKGEKGPPDPLVLTSAERQMARNISDVIGVDFDVVLAAFEQVTRTGSQQSRAAEAIIRKLGNHKVAQFRSSEAFGRIKESVNDAVSQGRISATDGATFLAQVEHVAFKAVDDTRTPFGSAEQVIDGLDVKFLQEGPEASVTLSPTQGRVRLQSSGDLSQSDFQYDASTGRAVLRVFKDGNIEDLWSAESQLMTRLAGPEFSQKMIKMFDHTVDRAGVAFLTPTGSRELASAWSQYRRTKSTSDTYRTELFHNLWYNLHHFFSKLKARPGLLQKQVKQFWDLEFGELPQDRYAVQAIVSDVRRANRKPIIIKGTELDQALNDRLRRQAQTISANEMAMSTESLRSYFGQKMRVVVDQEIDPITNRPVRIGRKVFDDFAYDPIEIGQKIYALIRVQDFRKRFASGTDVTVGTDRFAVAKYRQPAIVEATRKIMTDALGLPPDKIGMRVRQQNFQEGGPLGLTDLGMKNDIEGVTPVDITAFSNRIREQQQLPLHIKAENRLQQIIGTTPFIVLDAAEQAGLKTLLQEIGKNPLANFLPISLLDPDANLTILSVAEFNKIIAVVQDTTVSPIHRISRNQVHPGYLSKMSDVFKHKPLVEAISQILDKFKKKLVEEPLPINKKTADPAFVEFVEQWKRSLAEVPDLIAKAAETTPFKFPFDFYQDMVDGFIPKVGLGDLDTLFRLTDYFEGYKTRIDKDTQIAFDIAKSSDEQPKQFRVPTTFEIADDPITLQSLYKEIYSIQHLLDGFYGMTRQERKSLQMLRQLKIKRVGIDNVDLTPDQMNIVSEIVQTLMTGLQSKRDYVIGTANNLFARSIGDLDAGRGVKTNTYRLTHRQAKKVYRDSYTGNIAGLKKLATAKNLDGLLERSKRKLAKNSKGAAKFGDELSMMTNILVYMKQDEIMRGFGKQLSEFGYAKFRRQIVDTFDPVDGLTPDRSKYTDLVAQFIQDEMGFEHRRRIVKTEGQKDEIFGQPKPREELLGVFEKRYSRNDNQDYTRFENEARFEASRLLDSLGMQRQRGNVAEVFFGDKKFLIPENLVESINKIFEQTSQPARGKVLEGTFFERNIGPYGQVLYKTNENVKTPFMTQEIKNILTMAQQAGELLLSPSVYYRRLLIGTGGIPIVPYGFSMFVGGLGQIHAMLSTKSAAKSAKDTIKTPIEIAANKITDSNISFSAGVIARMFGQGQSKPKTKPLVTPDGRVYTAEAFSNAFVANGFQKSFAAAVSDPGASERIRVAFFQAHPEFTAMRIGGVLGTLIGTMNAGPVGAATGLVAGSGVGITVGKILSPKNPIASANNFYREFFNSIDLSQRVSVASELVQQGQSLQSAARNVRNINLDYSKVSEMDKTYFGRFAAFWTYFSQASQLFARVLVENPDKIVAQLKLARNSQLQALDFQDPDLALSPYDKTRVTLPFKLNGMIVRLPYMLVADILQLLIELVGSIGVGAGELEVAASRKSILNRANPFISEVVRQTLEIDLRGYDLERATFQIPAYLVQLDDDLTGGALRDKLNITYLPYDEIVTNFADDEGKKYLNPDKLEMPGRGIYIAQNKKTAAFLMQFLQTPFTGRAGKMLEAMDRSNIGFIESLLKISDVVRDVSGDKPAVSYIPGTTMIGFAKDKRDQSFRRPTDIDGVFDTATAGRSIRLGEPQSYTSRDGETVTLRRDGFFPAEAAKVILGGYAKQRSTDFTASRAIRSKKDVLDTKTDKQK